MKKTVLTWALAVVGCGGGAPMAPNQQSGSVPQAMPQATVAPTPTPTPTPPQPSPTPTGAIGSDDDLFKLITQDEPFQNYRLFPNTTEISSGRLDGAGAHPSARVRLNTPAFQSLDNGRLPSGGRFRSGSVIVKEVPSQNLWAVMRKDSNSSGAGWQWAEYRPNGSVVYSIAGRGGVCIECHSRQQGPVNDLVRTFERQQ